MSETSTTLRMDDDTFNSVYPAWKRLAERIVYSRLEPIYDPIDVIQNILLRAYLTGGSIREKEKENSWFSVLAKNEVRAVLSGTKKKFLNRRQVVDDGIWENLQDTRSLPDVRLSAKSFEEELSTLIDDYLAINPKQANALLLHIEGCSYRIAAERLGISIGTYKSRLFYAREHLKSCLENPQHF